MQIFLDACAIIYWVEGAEPFYSKFISKLEELAHKHPHHTLMISRLSLLECLTKPLREQNKKTLAIYQHFFKLPDLFILEIDSQVIDLATQIRAHYNLHTPDAIQAASCLATHRPHLFLTNDKCFNSISKLKTILI